MRRTVNALAVLFCLTLVLSTSATSQTFSVLHSFSGGPDGAYPYATVTLDNAGNLYGTAAQGGNTTIYGCATSGCGVVFKLSQKSAGWLLTPLYDFTGGSDGAYPIAPAAFGPGGLLYTSASRNGSAGGCYDNGCGVVLTLQPPVTSCKSALCYWTENSIYIFSSQEDGWFPNGNLTFDAAGNVYGVTQAGGGGACGGYGCGTVFELSRSGSGWTKSTIWQFYGEGQPAGPFNGMALDAAGNFYGSTNSGGFYNLGAAYELYYQAQSWHDNILRSFGNLADGDYGDSGVVVDNAGNIYGATANGGEGGGGVVYELSNSGGEWQFSILTSLVGPANSGPQGAMALDAAGNLYATTVQGGAHQCGNVFKLSPNGGQWTYTDLYDFTCGSDGGWPYAGVTLDSSGNIYGTATYYGLSNTTCSQGCGTVWKLTQ